ncbi:type II toxin-antitoxin system RelE/ParE family toxin [Candidatus Peregrinibacteria bacterium]|nr:type II toxin-antitoxin system RelE/ParE family toxin [Candidatus Peregrinibacteria bacterium]
MYEVLVSNYFAKQLKRLAKKNHQLKEKLRDSLFSFNRNQAISIGHGVYKFRVSAENRGKSGGYRVYVYMVKINKILTPIAIYPKNEKENLALSELSKHLEMVKTELAALL